MFHLLTGREILEKLYLVSKTPQSSKTEPKVFVTKIIGGKVFSTVLDKETAQQTMLQGDGYSLIADGENLGRVRGRITIQCPACGCSKEAFEETGRFGCPECYSAFGPFLPGLLKKMHKGLKHTGKISGNHLTKEMFEVREADLNRAIDSAIAAEDYEEAARLRDEILALRERRESLR